MRSTQPHRARAAAVTTIVVMALGACSGGTPALNGNSASPDAGAPFTTGVTTPAASPGLAESVHAAGFDAATAYVASATKSALTVTDGHTFVVKHAFPNGATAEMTYRVTAGDGKRTPADGVSLTTKEQGDRFLVTMAYAVDAATLPADLRASLTGKGGSAAGAPGTAKGPVVEPAAYAAGDSPSTVDVAVDGVVSQARESYVDTWVDRVDSKVTTGSWEAWKAGNKVWDAVGASDLVSEATAKLDALAACAENPTNALTKEQYAKDPGAKKKVTDELAAIKADIKENAAALFLQLLVDTGSSLVGGAKWLGFIVSPATSYIKETLSGLITDRVRAAEALVPRCTALSYEISGSSPSAPSGIRYSGKACSLEKRFTVQTTGDLVGALSFRPNRETGGTWAYTGKVGNAPFKVDGSGAYAVVLSGDARNGTLKFDFQSTVRIPQVGPQTGGGPVSLKLTATDHC